MIHMRSIFSSEANTSAAGQNNSPAPSQARLDSFDSDSFHGALSDAVSSKLDTPAATSTAPATANSSSSASSGLTGFEQVFAAFEQAEPAPSSASTLAPAASTPAASTTSAASSSTAAPGDAQQDAQQAFDNTYWASQPAPVQALRTMQNQEQRTALATQLANEGYSIDVPIMVWGWDPSTTMAARQSEGYTWVPSALQSPVEDAPGLPAFGTLAAYNPNNPPAGSIAV